jgi:hypothetical protein
MVTETMLLIKTGLKSKDDMEYLLRNHAGLSKQAMGRGCPTPSREPSRRCPKTTIYCGDRYKYPQGVVFFVVT